MVELLLEGAWVDITNQVKSVITYDKRVDEVFDTGTFSFESQAITYNIPPLTLCRIDEQYCFASSECNTIIPTAYYNHNVELLELTYIAHTTIIGTKAFSNKGAYKKHNDKIQILVELATTKNQVLFGYEGYSFEIEPLIESKNIEREFTFGAGTSLFIALLEIGKSVDAIPRITGFKTGAVGNIIWHIAWDYLDYNNTFTIDRNRLIQEKQFQDVENYTAMLEAEMQNVVDRDTIVEVKNLTVRSDDFYTVSDNQVLILPSNAEEIIDLRLDYDTIPATFGFRLNTGVDFLSSFVANNYYSWTTIKARIPQALVDIIEEQIAFADIPFSDDLQFLYGKESALEFVADYSTQTSRVAGIGIGIRSFLLDKKQWELLDISEQPRYYVFESGSNKIENMYDHYKNDIWSEILGETSLSPLEQNSIYFESDRVFDYNNSSVGVKIIFDGKNIKSNNAYNNPINGAKFHLKYKPMLDTFVKSTTAKKPYNESSIKPTSRSFEASASISDFNLLHNAINKSNKMIGMPEITLTYVGSDIPSPANLIEYRDKNYYVSSVQTTINLGKYTSYINLVSDYSKVAEVFGVASQYESTKLPLNNIVDRFVYCGKYNNSAKLNITGLRLGYTDSNGNTQYVYKRGAYVSYNGTTYYVVSANDQYTFETGLVENGKLPKGYENKQYAYANLNNEQVSYTLGLAIESPILTFNQAKDLPSLPYIYFDNILTSDILKVYKDARERLIFVYEVI